MSAQDQMLKEANSPIGYAEESHPRHGRVYSGYHIKETSVPYTCFFIKTLAQQ